MYISVRRYNITDTSAIDEIVSRATDGFIPIISQTPGFIAYYGVVAEDDVIATVSIFEDQAGADESNRRAAEWIKAPNTAALFGGHSALDKMLQGRVSDLCDVRRYLDAERGH